MGSVFFYFFFISSFLKVREAAAWEEVTCTIISSDVGSYRGSEGGTVYAPEIEYEYEYAGRTWRSDKVRFFGMRSSNRTSHANFVARFPEGSAAVCYVNPANPSEAVLDRGYSASMFFGLIPLVFVGVGVGGMTYAVRGMRNAKGKDFSPVFKGSEQDRGSMGRLTGEAVPGLPAVDEADFQESRLKPSQTALATCLAMVGVSIFWNGLVSVFVTIAARSWMDGDPEYFLTFFIIPFVLVGIGLIGGVFYFLLALFNPRPDVTVSAGAIQLGVKLRIKWIVNGRTGRMEWVRISLEGTESATYRVGTRSTTDTSNFLSETLFESSDRFAMAEGNLEVTIPADTMHSFEAHNNKITWELRFHGKISTWPDVKQSYPITVLPRKIA